MPEPMTDEQLSACKSWLREDRDYGIGSRQGTMALADCLAEIDRLKVAQHNNRPWVCAECRGTTVGYQTCISCVHKTERLDIEIEYHKLRAMLEKLEWLVVGKDDPYLCCPICDFVKGQGHADDCELAKLLEKHNAE